MKKQTTVLFVILFAVFVFAVAAQSLFLRKTDTGDRPLLERIPFIFNNAPSATPLPTPSDMTVTINFGDGNIITERAFGQTAYQVLLDVAKAKNWQVEAKDYKYGKMVERIGDKTSDKNHFWLYSVNGKAGQIAADRYVVYSGDTVEWKFVTN